MPTPSQLEARRDEVIDNLQKYRTQVNDAFDAIEQAISKGEYAYACSLMSAVSSHQGQASVNMRTTLVRYGFLARERDTNG